jgi:glutamyl-tRNA reductase
MGATVHMVDRHYFLNLKPSSARTLYVYAHVDLAQKYSVGLQEIVVSRLCSQEEFFSALSLATCLQLELYCVNQAYNSPKLS